MGMPKNLQGLMPQPGQKLQSVVVPVMSTPVDRPIIEETPVPSPLKPITPTEMLVEDVTHDEVPEAADLP